MMEFLPAFSEIANALDVDVSTLQLFHLLEPSIQAYLSMIKELYKELLKAHTAPLTGLESLQPFFHHVDLLLTTLTCAGGDTVITPRIRQFSESVESTFHDMLTPVNIQTLLKQIAWIVTRLGKTFGIAPMESLKID